MTTAAKSTFKTQIQYGDGGDPEAFKTLAEARNINPPEEAAEPLNATSHDSTAAEFITTELIDSGQIACDVNFIADTTQTAARAALGGVAGNWQICYTDFGQRTKTVTVNASTDVFTAVAHGLTTGQPVQISSDDTLPDGLFAETTYWVRKVDADTFTLHATNAGAVANSGQVTVTDTGTGTHTLQIGYRLSVVAMVTNHAMAEAPAESPSVRAASLTLKITGAVSGA